MYSRGVSSNMNIMPVFAFSAWLAFPASAGAHITVAEGGTPLVKARLVTEATKISGPFAVGLSFTIPSGWYLYWENPGDAGLPLDVKWKVPSGFQVTPCEYPTPEKIVHGDIVAYGYYDELLVQCTIIPPPGYAARADEVVRADLEWLVCKESCVPERDTLSLDLKRLSAATARSAGNLFGRFRARMPLPLSARNTVAGAPILRAEDGHIVVTIPLGGPGASGVTDFFPEPQEAFVIDHKSIAVAESAITLRLTPYDSAARLEHLDGLVIYGRPGYYLSVHFNNTP
jgi:DsbC/DsbD-like thiol-disulfide interchange protein